MTSLEEKTVHMTLEASGDNDLTDDILFKLLQLNICENDINSEKILEG